MTPQTMRSAAAGTVLVAVIAVLTYLATLPDAPPGQSEIGLPELSAVTPRKIGPIEAYTAISERVLFQPGRRPAPPPPPPIQPVAAATPPPSVSVQPPTPPPVLAPMILRAVILSNQKREAVLGQPNGTASTLAEGDQVDGWTLTQVLPNRVVFRRGEHEQEIGFPVADTATKPAAPIPRRPLNPTPATAKLPNPPLR
jgi:hypothetical protein